MITQVHSVSLWKRAGDVTGAGVLVARYPSPRGLPGAIRSKLGLRESFDTAVLRYVLVPNSGARAVELSERDVRLLSEARAELEFATAMPEAGPTPPNNSPTTFGAYAYAEPGHVDDAIYVLARRHFRSDLADYGLSRVDENDEGDLWLGSSDLLRPKLGDDGLWETIHRLAESSPRMVMRSELAFRIEASEGGGGITLDSTILYRLAAIGARIVTICTLSSVRKV